MATTNQPDTPLFFKSSNTRFSYNSQYRWAIPLLENLRTDKIIGGTATKDGSLILSGVNAVYFASKSSKALAPIKLPEATLNISIVRAINNNHFAVITDKKTLYLINSHTLKTEKVIDLNIPAEIRITDIEANDETIWIGSSEGIFYFNRDGIRLDHLHEGNSGLTHNYITSLTYRDHLWIGTYNGLNISIESGITTYNSKNASVYNDVLSFEIDDQNRPWIGTYNGIFVLNIGLQKHSTPSWVTQQLSGQRIMSLSKKGNDIWAGLQENGVYLISPSRQTVSRTEHPPLNHTSVTQILHDPDGNTWVATFDKGLFVIDDENNLIRMDSIPSPDVIRVFYTSKKLVIAITEKKIFIAESPKSKFVPLENSGMFNNKFPTVFSIAETTGGQLLIGTKDHGIFKANLLPEEGRTLNFERFSADSLLSKSTVYGILEDSKHRIWASTNNGIMLLSEHGSLMQRLTKSSGIQGDDFNFGAFYKSSNNRLYFGGVNGYSILDPGTVSEPIGKPAIVINSVDVPGYKMWSYQNRTHIDLLEVPTINEEINFSFAALDFVDTRHNQYKYLLEGYDQNWIDSGNNSTATYYNLPIGDYTFKVIGANAAGVWNTDGASLNIRIVPNWWETRLAYSVWAFILVVVLWLALRGYRTYLLKNKALALVDEISSQAYLIENELEEQRDYQDEVIKAISLQNHATLELIRSCIHTLENQVSSGEILSNHINCLSILEKHYHFQTGYLTVNLHDYVEQISVLIINERNGSYQPDLFSINRVTRQQVPANFAASLAIIIFELVSNSVHHAFVSESPVNYINVFFDVETDDGSDETYYLLQVSDDGVGLNPTMDPNTHQTPGFTIVRKLVETFGGELTWNNDEGLSIKIRYPFHQENHAA